jgi:hypothetical protein
VKRTFVAVALAVIFVLALAAPALASMTHTATYEMEGVINFKKQAGHACNTGGVLKQTIAGSGKMDKVMDIAMVPGKLTVADQNDWVAGATPLTVTSVWELCTPPKYTYDGRDTDGNKITAPVGITSLYNVNDIPAVANLVDSNMEVAGTTVAQEASRWGWDALTGQVWAVQVQADPGFSGNLHQKGEAAYGPYWSTKDASALVHAFDADWDEDSWSTSNTWRWERNKKDVVGVSIGADFVGDYFNMEQFARTSQGTLKRYIDVSSPWSHAYLMQDMTIVGKSEVKEGFSMPNIAAGKDVPKDWWRLF